ncbi:MAG TPA: tetratricopeptide repeat protein [Anaeromyxobacteraceae bacterium]|nr:tetratricopeptide repeat protein [Anaeromyxobacteraceae bacterium]
MSRRAPRLLPLLAAAALLACSSPERRIEAANGLRHAGDAKGALGAYKAILAELGEGPLPQDDAGIRLKALRFAGDVSYLELGDYTGALSYYRRIVSLYPGGAEAHEARGIIGDIYRDRLNDPLAAIAQYADVAASDAPTAPTYQLKIARAYLALGRYEQARTEARILRERWPTDEMADEAQLLAAQAWALEKRDEEALGAFQALIDRKPRPDIAARALEGEAHIYAQAGRFNRALELYTAALPTHPNPDAILTNIEAVRERRERAKTATPGDRAAAFDHGKVKRSPREEP